MNSILIVEDEERIRKVFKQWLDHEGYIAWEAPDAQTARERLWAVPIDLVLLDLKMPNVTGQELYTLIRTFHKRVKILTASVYPIEQQKNMIEDADDYHDKSDGNKMLLEKIKNALNDYSSIREFDAKIKIRR